MSLLEREVPGVVMTPDNIRSKKLPLVVDLGIAVAALLVSAAVVLGLGLGNWVLVVVLGIVFYLAGLFAAATRVEGRRSARNRLWKTLIYAACILAILPLASVVWTLVSKGAARLDGDFFG
ncbi:phosphate ABC transporter permease PstA, partial [Actinoplanes sp. NPDC004185]